MFVFVSHSFRKNFRLTKAVFVHVLDEISDSLPTRIRDTSIRHDIGLCMILRHLAHGDYQLSVGNQFVAPMDRSTVSKKMDTYLGVMEDILCEKWITVPTDLEKQDSMAHFLQHFRFPGIIGCVDGTHIYCISPGSNRNEAAFVNRKSLHSVNVMVICDHTYRIRYIDCRHSGSNHDSFVWQNSHAYNHFKNNQQDGEWLLGN